MHLNFAQQNDREPEEHRHMLKRMTTMAKARIDRGRITILKNGSTSRAYQEKCLKELRILKFEHVIGDQGKLGQEDHVSMGANAATQAYRLIDNVERVLAIELFNASQAIHFREPLKSSEFIELFLQSYRVEVPFVKEDEILHDDIEMSIQFIKNLGVDSSELFN